MGIEKSHVLILNKVNYSDTSLIIVALSPEEGILRLMGKGFRKPPTRSFSGREPIETFSEMEFSYFRSTGELHHLRECNVINPHWAIREKYENLLAASFAAGLALDFSSVGGDGEYKMLHELFHSIGKNDSSLCLKVMRYWIRLLSLGGFLPSFDGCSSCGAEFDPENIEYIAGRGFLCARCSCKRTDVSMKLTKGDLRYAGHILGPNQGSRIKMAIVVRHKLVSLLCSITAHEVGRPPRLLDRLRKICDNE